MDLTPTRQTPVSLPAVKRSGQRYWFLGLAGVLVALALIAGGAALLLLRQQPGQPALTSATATALVQEFYRDVNAKNYRAAYALLSNEWQQQTNYTDFSNGYHNTLKDTLEVDSTQTLADETIQVNVQLQALEQRADGTQGTSTYSGFYVIDKEGGKLRMLRGMLTQTAQAGT